jgi:hypothetical protein
MFIRSGSVILSEAKNLAVGRPQGEFFVEAKASLQQDVKELGFWIYKEMKNSHTRKVVFRSRRGREREKLGPRARRWQSWVTALLAPRAQWDFAEP